MADCFHVDMAFLAEAETMSKGKAAAEPSDLAGSEAVRLLRQLVQRQGKQVPDDKPDKKARDQKVGPLIELV